MCKQFNLGMDPMTIRMHRKELTSLSISCLFGIGLLVGCGSGSEKNRQNAQASVNGTPVAEGSSEAASNLPPMFGYYVFENKAYIVMPQKGCFKAETSQNLISITQALCVDEDAVVKVVL